MSEELEKVEGLRQIPIFPLPLVLLPFEMLPLHIFEPKYRQMLEDVKPMRNIFGVSRFEPADEPATRPPVGSIGCAAEIREVHELEDGRSNILTLGLTRYIVNEYVDLGDPYLVAEVDFFEDDSFEEEELGSLPDDVFHLFRRVAEAAHKMSGKPGDFPEIPQAEPQQLSFLISAAFNLDNELKYKMMEIRSTQERLFHLREILSQAVGQVEESAKINKVSRTNGHVNKKINLD